MHPYLTRLGIRREVQEFFAPHYYATEQGSLFFDYGDAVEHFGFAFHRIPVSENCWVAGCPNFDTVSKVFICSSAMEAISFYHYKYPVFSRPESLLFLSVGGRPNASQFRWINENLPGKEFLLVFGSDLLDRIAELKTAAALRKIPLDVRVCTDAVFILFRLKEYAMDEATLSLSNFEKLSGYRFNIKTSHAKTGGSYMQQLIAAALNH